jgi:hypothetical protein
MGKEAAGVKPRYSTSLWMLQELGTFSKNEEQNMETFLNTEPLPQVSSRVSDPIPFKGTGLHAGVTSARLVHALAD